MIDKLLCHTNNSLLDALQIINNNAKGLVFIINESNKLSGILTDGDIRRLLIAGCDLQQTISNVISNNFVYATTTDSYTDIINKLDTRIKIIPIVDSNFHVVDFFELKNDIHFPVASPYLKGNEFKYLVDAFMSSWISSTGKYIDQFEKEFSSFCGTKYSVAVSNGTTALHLALLSLNIGPGDEVIVPDLTFAATINVVLHCGATPVIVDINEDSWCIEPLEILKALSPKTRAIIPVHLYGQVCNMDEIMEIAHKNNLFVIEDCAEAHGALYKSKKVGSIGDIGCFSFYGNKIITTGEGGMCVTNDENVFNKIKILRDHGMSRERRYWHDIVGYNFRLTNLQAAIGLAQLERIENIIEMRSLIELKYKKVFSKFSFIEFQKDMLDCTRVVWLMSILVSEDKRDQLLFKMKEAGIDTRQFFFPLSEMPIYNKYLFSNTVSTRISRRGINLPTTFDLDDTYYEKVFNVLNLLT